MARHGDTERIAAHMISTFWYVLPSLPIFLLMPAMLRNGVGFAPSLAVSCALCQLRTMRITDSGSQPPLPANAKHMTQRISTAAEKCLNDKCHRPKGRKFPAPTFVGEQPAFRAM